MRTPVRTRQRAEQPERVGHALPVEDVVDRTGLHELPRVHHANAVREACHDTKIVRDQQDRGACDFARLL